MSFWQCRIHVIAVRHTVFLVKYCVYHEARVNYLRCTCHGVTFVPCSVFAIIVFVQPSNPVLLDRNLPSESLPKAAIHVPLVHTVDKQSTAYSAFVRYLVVLNLDLHVSPLHGYKQTLHLPLLKIQVHYIVSTPFGVDYNTVRCYNDEGEKQIEISVMKFVRSDRVYRG